MMEMAPLREIAIWLDLKMNSGNSPVLFLGSRTGRLFGNPTLYHWIEQLSGNPTFASLSDTQKFARAYEVLAEQVEMDVHDILVDALKAVNQGDIYLAELVKSGFFDFIISTSIDVSLEETFDRVGLRRIHDYRILWPGERFGEQALRIQRLTVLKVFGDLMSREYNAAGNALNLSKNLPLKSFLENVLQRDVLIVGYDPTWDASLESAFPTVGGSLWYINDGPLGECHLARAIKERRGKYLVGEQGNSQRFFQLLYTLMLNRDSSIHVLPGESHTNAASTEITPVAPPPPITQEKVPPQKEQSKKVFISYSHQDSRHLERLKIHLAGSIRDELIDVWDDTKIAVGADWRKEIERALDEAKIAILLVSADFAASDFIAKNELPKLLDAARTGGTRIIIVILNHYNFKDTPLSHFQAVNTPSRPLSEMRNAEKEAIWAKVAKIVKDA